MATLSFHFESLSAPAGPVTKLLASLGSWRLGFSVGCRFGREVFGVIYAALESLLAASLPSGQQPAWGVVLP